MNHANKIKIIFVLSVFTLLVTVSLVFGISNINSLALKNQTKKYHLIVSETLPTTIYENSISDCLVGKSKKRIRKKNGEVLRTKPVTLRNDHRKNTFSVVKFIYKDNQTSKIRYEATVFPCQILQMYVLWKENAGKLNSDKKIIEFSYKVLSTIGLASVNINGRGDEGYAAAQANVDLFNMQSILYTGNYDKEDLKDIAIKDLGGYKEQYERNSASFENVNLLTKYSLLQYLRYSRTLSKSTLSLFPLFTVFNEIQSSFFYKELFRASNNASKSIKLTFHYARENSNGDVYFAE